ncbi:MAG: penicillin-binding transpeptidase domain-containing protein, partial [Acutalibacteraceae bacterium]
RKGARGVAKSILDRSFIIMLALIVAGFGGIAIRLGYIMTVDADDLRSKAENQQLRDVVTTAGRGNIYDCNKNVLAKSSTVWKVFVTPSSIEKDERDLIAKGLSELLGVEYDTVYEKVCKTSSYYETVGKPVDIGTATKVREFIKENEVGSVVGLEESSKRYYPNNNLASTVIGFVGTDNQGLGGLEYYYDKELTGTKGRIISAKNAKGSDLPFSYEKVVEAKEGNSLVLTIDEYIQHIVEKYLLQAINENKVANRGSCIVMNVNTGEILAMATMPDYDLNNPFTIANEEKAKEIASLTGDERSKAISEAQQAQWRNKCISDAYEPGSVFKIITGSSALEEGTLKTTDTFYCPGYITVADRKIRCHKTEGHGSQSLANAFQNSCNPAFISIGQKLGLRNFVNYRTAYGLDKITGIDLPGETGSILHSYESMGPVELASESFGQSFKITPIQLITAISAAVNGGYLNKPHVVKQILDSDGNVVKNYGTTQVRQVISNETSKQICQYLESVVSEGTGHNAYVAGYRVGGKTGTSEKLDSGTNKKIASFCGIAPSDSPEVAILMLLDEPNVAYPFGGTCCAPAVGKMMSEILPYLSVSPEYTEEEAKELESTTPNVTGKSLKDAKSAISDAELKYTVIGEGDTVIKQMPSANSTIPNGGTVVLYTDDSEQKKTAVVPDFNGMTISQANEAAENAGINIIISGSKNNATAYDQSVEKGKEVERGTVVTVSFREIVVVE